MRLRNQTRLSVPSDDGSGEGHQNLRSWADSPVRKNAKDSKEEKGDAPKAKDDAAKRYSSFKTRTGSTLVLIGGFLFLVWAGHVPLMLLVLALQALMISEAFGLGQMAREGERLPGFRAKQWYFFGVAVFYLYTRFITNNLMVEVTSTKALAKVFAWALKRHILLSFFLYCAGFMMFVLSLKRGMYLYQFTQYAWTHMVIMVVVIPTSFFIPSIFNGIIWYLLPAMLIIVNDIFAYLAGFFFGRTPLILLSPKKTWEGFIGGFICTAGFAFYASWWMAQSTWLTCPRKDLSLGPLHCNPSPIFQTRTFTIHELAAELPGPLEEILALLHSLLPGNVWDMMQTWTITAMPVQLHAMSMSCFASFISPFGGFFASGLKRAFELKDFGDTIPGHGGITDRFDCQVLMALFSSLYYWNYVHVEVFDMGSVLSEALKLPNAQQVELFVRLGNMLVGEGLIPSNTLDSLPSIEMTAN